MGQLLLIHEMERKRWIQEAQYLSLHKSDDCLLNV